MQNCGFILLARKYLESETLSSWPPLYRDLWIWMLLRASYKPAKGCQRGEFFTSIKEMQDRGSYKVGYRTVRPTRDQIRNFYEAATNTHMITTTKTTRGLKINILNYGKYQSIENYEPHNESHNESPHESPNDPTLYVKKGKKERITLPSSEGSVSSPVGDNAPPSCPHKAIIELYNKICSPTGMPTIMAWDKQAQSWLQARWREDGVRQDLGWWEAFFTDRIITSDFLTGRVKEWKADLRWIVRPANFTKILNGNYVNKNGTSPVCDPVLLEKIKWCWENEPQNFEMYCTGKGVDPRKAQKWIGQCLR